MGNLINCSKISVDCVINDPVDVKAGGPEYLGFDFFVKNTETMEITKFIIQTLNEFNIPLISIGVIQKNILLTEKEIWDKNRIAECIAKQADYLIRESKRNYKLTVKTKTR